jgi:hypothetical protein
VTVCTLKGLSGQYDFHELFDSVHQLIGEIDRQTLPKRCSDYFRHVPAQSLPPEFLSNRIFNQLDAAISPPSFENCRHESIVSPSSSIWSRPGAWPPKLRINKKTPTRSWGLCWNDLFSGKALNSRSVGSRPELSYRPPRPPMPPPIMPPIIPPIMPIMPEPLLLSRFLPDWSISCL